MSEKELTIDDLTKQYGDLCAKAGHIKYQIFIMEYDLNKLHEAMKSINNQAAELKAKEKKPEVLTPEIV